MALLVALLLKFWSAFNDAVEGECARHTSQCEGVHPFPRLLTSANDGDGAEHGTILKDVRGKGAVGEGNADMNTPGRKLTGVRAQIRAKQRPILVAGIYRRLLADGEGILVSGIVGKSMMVKVYEVGRELRHTCDS